jgi:bacteriocin biosynthesis cyclodehydratase domain-containing protein
MRPALKPGLLAVWRDRDTLQIGIHPRRAIALTGMAGTGGLLRLLDGSRDRAQVLAAAEELGIPGATADRMLTLLAAAGALHDFPAGSYRALPEPSRRRLLPELATAALAHGDSDGGARMLARRRAAWIRVQGTSRPALAVAALLTAAGVGRVSTGGPAGTGPGACPAPPPTGFATGAGPARPDLVVLAGPHYPELAAALVGAGIPHLAVTAGEAIGTVGPLVLPGRSACLRCLDLHRASRDPAWPRILAQMAAQQPEPAACDAPLTAAVAAQAAVQILYSVDRASPPGAVINGTLELVLPGWQWQRRSWLPHPRCGCGSRSRS